MTFLKYFLVSFFVSFLFWQPLLWATGLETVFYNVGQGKCAIVHKAGYVPLIVDAGAKAPKKTFATISEDLSDRIVEEGNQANIVISHGHADHTNLLPKIVNALKRARHPAPPCKIRFFAGGEPNDYKKDDKKLIEEFRTSGNGEALFASEITGDVSAPNFSSQDQEMRTTFLSTTVHRGENDRSLVTKVTYKGKSIVFTGDATGRTTENIPATDAKSDVFDSDHHGADTDGSNNSAWIGKVSPQYTVFSAAKDSEYHHPRFEVVKRVCTRSQPDGNYDGVGQNASKHLFSFYAPSTPTPLDAMEPYTPTEGKPGWYSTSTTRQIFNTADVGSILCKISDAQGTPITVEPLDSPPH